MFSTFDLRLLLYVIRLAGWLKHCNLSLYCISEGCVQYAPVKVQLLVVQPKVLGTHSRCLRIPNRRSTDFTLLSNMSPGINLFDGTFEHDGRLDSGLAFAQQQAELCLQPTANNQPPVMDQCKQLLADQANRLQRSFDDKLKAQARSFDDKLQAQTE